MLEQRLRIALYSHDTMGLGHMRRNLLIAEELASSAHRPSVLLITGSKQISRFALPPGVDVLSLPALYKDSASQYQSRSLHLPLHEIIALRSASILGALEGFRPDVFIVDNVPRGAVGELEPALRAMKRRGTTCVLGLRDILDDAEHVQAEWARAANVLAVRRYYRAIWVYGDRDVADVAGEYRFPDDVAQRVRYTGYLNQCVRGEGLSTTLATSNTILCLVGGGQDGIQLAESFARAPWQRPHRGLLVTGPMMSSINQRRVREAAAHGAVDVVDFIDDPAAAMRAAHAVITMGGYNTICDVLSHGARALIVPRTHPRTEQLIRAERLASRGLFDMMLPDAVTPAALTAWVSQAQRSTRSVPVRMHTTAGLHTLLDEALAIAAPSSRIGHAPLEACHAR